MFRILNEYELKNGCDKRDMVMGFSIATFKDKWVLMSL